MKKDLKNLFKRIEKGQVSNTAFNAELKRLETGQDNQTDKPGDGASVKQFAERFEEKALVYFHKSLANTMKLPLSKVDVDSPLESYGLDSVMVISVTNQLEQDFGSLSKTLLYEYQTIRELASHFVAHHSDKLAALVGIEAVPKQAAVKQLSVATQASKAQPDDSDTQEPAPSVTVKAHSTLDKQSKPSQAFGKKSAKNSVKNNGQKQPKPIPSQQDDMSQGAGDIAIVGLSGRYPKAVDLKQYWHNLRDGVDCITEVPEARWDHSLYYDPDQTRTDKTYLKWGGFIDGVDQFDPLFFGISPREALRMDPQDRLFLQCVYEVIEDAGYTRQTLAATQGEGGEVGVYVGVMYEEYQLYGAQSTILGEPTVMSGNPASIANRVSYYCNFHGPSMTVDTMCSSSLTTIHLACQSINNGECSAAIAGGVNVSVHPNKFMLLGLGRFASSVGRCGSFGEGGDGYVPGEGVGAVLLKPLSQAEADGDHIYGVVKGSAINHGGKTNGYTVPSPKSQHQVISSALKRANLPATAISYIEAHGTGTSLGDPIEISGLGKAFSAYTDAKQFCAIGSAKSNIGHCESAAGIAGVTKVLLQMRHGQIVPSLHSSTLNPNIDFANSPFVVQQQLADWPRPVIHDNGQAKEYPRIAGISSFGAGGANAHIVIEEYRGKPDTTGAHQYEDQEQHQERLILLSAKTPEALEYRAADLLTALDDFSAGQLGDIAYTLQVGREAMVHRVAFVAASIEALKAQLSQYLAGQDLADGVYQAEQQHSKSLAGAFSSDEDLAQVLTRWMAKGKLAKLADFWVHGVNFDWQALYRQPAAGQFKRLSLPVYRFAQNRYWLDLPDSAKQLQNPSSQGQLSYLHPLLHRNTSTLTEQRFSSLLSGDEYYLADHQVQGKRVLPAAVQLEMAREAIAQSVDGLAQTQYIQLKQVVFVQPLAFEPDELEQSKVVHVKVSVAADNRLNFSVFSDLRQHDDDTGQIIVHTQGSAELHPLETSQHIDLAEFKQLCTQSLSVDDCYQQFAEMALDYGPAMRPLNALYRGETTQHKVVLGQLRLPQQANQDSHNIVINPSLFDGCLQSAIALVEQGSEAALPFAIESLSVYASVAVNTAQEQRQSDSIYALIHFDKDQAAHSGAIQKLSLDVCNEQGAILLSIKGFSSRVLKTQDTDAPATTATTASTVSSNEPVTEVQTITEVQSTDIADAPLVEGEAGQLKSQTQAYIGRLLSDILSLPVEQINVAARFDEYGIDSVVVMDLTNTLEQQFGSLPKTLFFEYQTIEQLCGYFIQNHGPALTEMFNIQLAAKPHEVADKAITAQPQTSQAVTSNDDRAQPVAGATSFAANRLGQASAISSAGTAVQPQGAERIAIIGISGRYPMANDLDEYWQNLKAGKSCISEIPPKRWDHQLYFDQDKQQPGKCYSKWGGFIEGIDEFDPLFFNISPLEAAGMDPQERLFLQCVYSAIEDAGYTWQSFGQTERLGVASNVGVYVGVMYEEYQLYAAQAQQQGQGTVVGGNASSVANRVSHYCNFHGPSMAVDTMCSSSITAIHLACESIARGHCEQAIAGGVNLSVHPNKYLLLSQGRFASSDGLCRSFGEGGDGYVPGEGVGAVLLKPLAYAEQDNDHIYGVIRGSALNHGGKTNGYTVPNPNAQHQVIAKVLKQSGVPARAVSYIEAHGTGTALGDPIEVSGLTRAFREYTDAEQFCAIGSAKSNIGHCESAAGIAGITKVLLQMRHGQLVPSIHSQTLNPNIDFANSPFVVQQQLSDWPRPVFSEKGIEQSYPRIAGVSSFGAGGANAHIIIEEYIQQGQQHTSATTQPGQEYLILLSAKTAEALNHRASDLLRVLADYSDAQLADIAYTLQVGREAMDERIALVVNSIESLGQQLTQYLAADSAPGAVYQARQKHHKVVANTFADDDLEQALSRWIAKGKLGKLAELWVHGVDLDWQKLYAIGALAGAKRVSLPGYQFAKEQYWIEKPEPGLVMGQATAGSAQQQLHPLLPRNTSTLAEQRFSSDLNGREYYLADHQVQGKPVLPAAAQLEMAREALAQSIDGLDDNQYIEFKDIAFIRPLVLDGIALKQMQRVHINVELDDDGDLAFNLYADADDATEPGIIYTKGRAQLQHFEAGDGIDLTAQKQLCTEPVSVVDCYQRFAAMGVSYGPAMQPIKALWRGQTAEHKVVLAQLNLPQQATQAAAPLVINPSLLDGCLQSAIALVEDGADGALPFAIESLSLFGTLGANFAQQPLYVVVRLDKAQAAKTPQLQKLDFDVCNEHGQLLLSIQGFSSRVLKANQATEQSASAQPKLLLEKPDALFLAPVWHPQSLAELPPADGGQYSQHWVLLCDNHQAKSLIEAELGAVRCHLLGQSLSLDALQDSVALAEHYHQCSQQLLAFLQQLFATPSSGKILLQLVVSDSAQQAVFAGLAGMLKSAAQENSRLSVQQLLLEASRFNHQLADLLRQEANIAWAKLPRQVRFTQGRREVLELQQVLQQPGKPQGTVMPWRDGGVYLITGGTKGLGLLFAFAIAAQVKDATLVLSARSALADLSQQQQQKVAQLQALGATVEVCQSDVSEQAQVDSLVRHINHNHGQLNGIIHSAGVLRDGIFLNKSATDLTQVLAPKVSGVAYLDEASKDCALECFILFSSISGITGNIGQCDYAAANGFMDAYAHYRNQLVAQGMRRGRSLSVNWPLWADGGMQVDEATRGFLWQNLGMKPLQSEIGIASLNYIWSQSGEATGQDSAIANLLVVQGDEHKLKTVLQVQTPRQSITGSGGQSQSIVVGNLEAVSSSEAQSTGNTQAQSQQELQQQGLQQQTYQYLREVVAGVIALPPERLNIDQGLDHYGIDSILIMKLTETLEQAFSGLSKTLFFEYQTIRELGDHLLASHGERLKLILATTNADEPSQIVAISQDKGAGQSPIGKTRLKGLGSRLKGQKAQNTHSDIAIVGMSGRYANSDDLSQLWQSLAAGQSGISEVPQERWDHQQYYTEQRGVLGKSYTKWAGFMTDIDKFDPLFFNISPRETEYIDPQERLFLQQAYRCIEDAGYTPQSLACDNKVGVYVGVMNGRYHSGAQYWSIANRVSYLFNFHGPSFAIDSACSSSLTAMHLAMESLQAGKSACALVGGVNLIVSAKHLVVLSGANMLSEGPDCRSFGEHADGFVDSEGVGALLLKPLAHAERDNDQIYGVLKGSAINHGGKTNGYTVPNPKAQAMVISEALAEAGVPARAISYIEAHGTGTPLGDPIEITGLTNAFAQFTSDKQFCAIGSIKSNLGHCESAAGVAGVSKVLLQMKHRQLVPSLHSARTNPNIDFAKTPFTVQQQLQPWQRPVISENGVEKQYPRTAGISSFGAGGANAHIIIQEYQGPARVPTTLSHPAVIVLSAKTQTALVERAAQLAAMLSAPLDGSLHDVAYTLQVGREAMKERLSLLVEDLAQLSDALQAFVDNRDIAVAHARGKVMADQDGFADALSSGAAAGQSVDELIADTIAQQDWQRLMALWIKGAPIDWSLLYGDKMPHRISLPTYPFAKQSYWSEGDERQNRETKGSEPIVVKGAVKTQLHPLLHQNLSQLNQQCFETQLTGQEFFLADHQVQNMAILPCVAQLEMVRAAFDHSLSIGQSERIELTDVSFIQPIVVAATVCLKVTIAQNTSSAFAFELLSERANDKTVYSKGRARLIADEQPAPLCIESEQASLKSSLDANHCYQRFASMGIDYGPAMKALVDVHLGQDPHGAFVVAELSLPSHLPQQSEYGLHPSMMDASLQAAIGFVEDIGEAGTAMVPFSVDCVTAIAAIPSQAKTLLRVNPDSHGDMQKLDIDICTMDGQLCVSIKGFTTRAMKAATAKPQVKARPEATGLSPLRAQTAATTDGLLLSLNWQADDSGHSNAPFALPEEHEHCVILCSEQFSQAEVEGNLPGVKCIALSLSDDQHDEQHSVAERFSQSARQLNTSLTALLEQANAGVLLQVVVPVDGDWAFLQALRAMLTSAELACHRLRSQLIALDDGDTLTQVLHNESGANERVVRYLPGQRQVLQLEEVAAAALPHNHCLWKEQGVYLISGANTVQALAVATDIATKVHNPVLFLISHLQLVPSAKAQLNHLTTLGARVEFEQVDVTDFEQVRGVVATIDNACGRLNGIIHCADSNHHSNDDGEEALSGSLVAGTVNLDVASQGLSLDCFVVFSSLAAVTGSDGQSLYAANHAFANDYVGQRNQLVGRQQRCGQSLALNCAGRSGEGEMQSSLWTEMGIEPVTPAFATQALHGALQANHEQVLVLCGDAQHLRKQWGLTAIPEQIKVTLEAQDTNVLTQPVQGVATLHSSEIQLKPEQTGEDDRALQYFKQFMADYLKLPHDLLDVDERLDNFGIDSVMVMSLLSELEKDFGSQPKTLFFEYQTVRELTGYFAAQHSQALQNVLDTDYRI